MTEEHNHDRVARLLKLAGDRPSPSPELEARVFAATLAEWENARPTPAEPKAARRWPYALAASLLMGVLAGLLMTQPLSTPEPIGRIVVSTGPYELRGGEEGTNTINEQTVITTSSAAYVGTQLGDGLSVRFAPDTRVTFNSTNEIRLHRGRVYVDNQRTSSGLVVVTPLGEIEDIGTQFEVLLEGRSVDVSVREGAVRVRADGVETVGRAENGWGDVIRANAMGASRVSRLRTTDARWHWVQQAAGGIAAASFHDYLSQTTRELGLELEYASEPVRAQAEIVPPFQALSGTTTPDRLVTLINEGTRTFEARLSDHALIVDFER